jgi:hypothetical protein
VIWAQSFDELYDELDDETSCVASCVAYFGPTMAVQPVRANYDIHEGICS